MDNNEEFQEMQEVDNINPEIDGSVVDLGEVERQSYSKYAYKNVQKQRDTGVLYGVDIPYLKYPLKKAEKPRGVFLALAIISAICLAVVVGFVAYMTVTFLFPLFVKLIGITDTLTTRVEYDIFGLFNAVGTLSSFFMWGLFVIFVFLFIAIVIIMVNFTRHLFGMTKISMQEAAVGHKMRSMIIAMGVSALTVIAIVVALFVTIPDIPTKGVIILSAIGGVLLLIFGGIFALLLVEKNKAKKEFNELPMEAQQDFIEHDRALKNLANRKKRRKELFNDTTKKRSVFSLLSFLGLIIDTRVIYNNVKSNEGVRSRTNFFAVSAFGYMLLFALLGIGGVAILSYGITIFVSAIILAIILIVLSVYMILYSLPYVVLSLNLIIKQLHLNKKFLGWLALVTWIVMIIAFVLIFLLVTGIV